MLRLVNVLPKKIRINLTTFRKFIRHHHYIEVLLDFGDELGANLLF